MRFASLFLSAFLSLPVAAQSVQLAVEAASDIVRDSETVVFTVAASNVGNAPQDDVTVFVLLPDGIDFFESPDPAFQCNFDCGSNETAQWVLGTLAPGESRRVELPIEIDQDDGVESTMTATYGSAFVEETVTSSDAPPVSASLSGPDGPVRPGQPLTLSLSYANRQATTLPGLTLRMPVPDGTSFVRASHGGTLSGGAVEWTVGALGTAAGGVVDATFAVPGNAPEGYLLHAEGSVDPASPGSTVTAHAVWEVSAANPLQLSSTATTLAVRDAETAVHLLTLSNTGQDPAFDVVVSVLLPDEIDFFESPDPLFQCNFDCGSNETARWVLGTLAPGASRSIALPIEFRSNTRDGRILRLRATTNTPGVGSQSAGVDVRYDEEPSVEISVTGPDGPLAPGSEALFTVSFANRRTTTIPGLTLRLGVPRGTSLVSASTGGQLTGDIVEWTLGAIGTMEGGYVEATLALPPGARPGSHLQVWAEADPSAPGETVRSQTTQAVLSSSPLHLTYAPTRRSTNSGQVVLHTLRVQNVSSEQQNDVVVSVLLPDEIDFFSAPDPLFQCNFDCGPNETARWVLGTLAPGASRSIALPIEFRNNTRDGRILRSVARAEALGVSHVLAQADVLFGTVVVTEAAASPSSPSFQVTAYPNPVLADATFEVTLVSPGVARVVVFDVLGRRLATVHDGPLPQGTTSVRWNAAEYPAGPYVYRVESGGEVRSGTLVKR